MCYNSASKNEDSETLIDVTEKTPDNSVIFVLRNRILKEDNPSKTKDGLSKSSKNINNAKLYRW